MLTSTRIAQRRLLAATKTAGLSAQYRARTTIPRATSIQTRSVVDVPSKDPDNMGGPGGQEHYPESAGLRRRYAMNTMYGVMAVCSILLAAKFARTTKDPNANYVLVHDSSKGELDDVKYVKAADLPKS
ncbi:hypothetical protein NEMBOFW57_009176 [Staphylotrichum longicolle]|uniref:Uncharacterized protein n=1 Tax=Staphylotrichum longicolle TaxID=669026 RepID=A0AAD4ESN4_9PEZI|nr:hypothetical protein NEMBOFW57_009176 [Staphylotrichum longicolle]